MLERVSGSLRGHRSLDPASPAPAPPSEKNMKANRMRACGLHVRPNQSLSGEACGPGIARMGRDKGDPEAGGN